MMVDNHWHHMCLAWATKSKRFRFHIDGKNIESGYFRIQIPGENLT
mgnify:CR=1 FL=1